jgi:hypothetical protein
MIVKHIRSTAIVILLITGISCGDDFLETPPQNQLTQENFPQTADDALSATNAIYEVLRQSTYHRGFYPIDDVMSDDARKGSSPGDSLILPPIRL